MKQVICAVDRKRLQKGVDYIYANCTDRHRALLAMDQAVVVYFNALNGGESRKAAISFALFEVAEHDLQVWNPSLWVAFGKSKKRKIN